MPPVTYVPSQADWAKIYADQATNSPLAIVNKAKAGNTVAAPGSTNAVTAAGNPNLNNLSNPDWIKAMSEMISQINIDAQQKANASRIPGAAGLEKQSSGNIADALAGKLPSDVINQIAQTSAERGVSTGNPMGASTNADLLKAIGLNSLQLQNTGQSWLDQALGRNPAGQVANTQGLVTTPAQAEQLALARQAQELDYLKFLQSLNARSTPSRTGYGGGGGYPTGGGGSFAPATNWSGINLPTTFSGNQGINQTVPDTVLPGMDMPYYNPANDVVQPGNNYDPNTMFPANWGGYDVNPVSYNPEFYPDYYGGGGNNNSLSDEEWWNLFGGG